jgi:predicted GNAT superfamily acetyltransferase
MQICTYAHACMNKSSAFTQIYRCLCKSVAASKYRHHKSDEATSSNLNNKIMHEGTKLSRVDKSMQKIIHCVRAYLADSITNFASNILTIRTTARYNSSSYIRQQESKCDHDRVA